MRMKHLLGRGLESTGKLLEEVVDPTGSVSSSLLTALGSLSQKRVQARLDVFGVKTLGELEVGEVELGEVATLGQVALDGLDELVDVGSLGEDTLELFAEAGKVNAGAAFTTTELAEELADVELGEVGAFGDQALMGRAWKGKTLISLMN